MREEEKKFLKRIRPFHVFDDKKHDLQIKLDGKDGGIGCKMNF